MASFFDQLIDRGVLHEQEERQARDHGDGASRRSGSTGEAPRSSISSFLDSSTSSQEGLTSEGRLTEVAHSAIPHTDPAPPWLPAHPPPAAPPPDAGSERAPTPEPAILAVPRAVRVVRDRKADSGPAAGPSSPRQRVQSSGTAGSGPRPGPSPDPEDQHSFPAHSIPASLPRWPTTTSAAWRPARFDTPDFHPELLRTAAPVARLRFWLLRASVCAYVPVETFLDFNVVYMLMQIAMYPSPKAPGVPGTGGTWRLAAIAYILCWASWLFGIFLCYDVLYCFVRRWRSKRPLMLPLFLSAAAFDLVRTTSFTRFCFFNRIRAGASARQRRLEWAWRRAQNAYFVALAVPRAFLAGALAVAFAGVQPGNLALLEGAARSRDATFFNERGALTGYASVVLGLLIGFTAVRAGVLLLAWGMLIVAALPYRLDESSHRDGATDREKQQAPPPSAIEHRPNNGPQLWTAEDVLSRAWRANTATRIQDAWDACVALAPDEPLVPPVQPGSASRWSTGSSRRTPVRASGRWSQPSTRQRTFEGIDTVLADMRKNGK